MFAHAGEADWESILSTLTPRQVDVACDLLNFLLRYPDVLDTIDAYARWRLAEEAARRTLDDVGHAVEWLVDREILRSVEVLGLMMFGLRIEHRAAAELTLVELSRHGRCSPSEA